MENKQIAELHKRFVSLQKKKEKAGDTYRKKVDKARCHLCQRYGNPCYVKRENIHDKCVGCKSFFLIRPAYDEFLSLIKETDSCISDYAKEIYKILRKENPYIVRRGNNPIPFLSVFDHSIEQMTKSEKELLVCLLEGGGPYRISNN